MPICQLFKPSPTRQRHRRNQPGERHEARIIEACRAHRNHMRELHLRDALRDQQDRALDKLDSPATEGAFSLYDPLINPSPRCIRA